jgi:NTE family protein
MAYYFRNLVFEGGGVKGIAYVGAMEALGRRGVLKDIVRVGGTSAGAINATLFALGYTNAQTKKILRDLDFSNFLDENWGIVRDTQRLVNRFGWYKGDFFHGWIGELVAAKLGNASATFSDLRAAGRPDLYVYGTNLSTTFGEVFSVERTPNERIADAVRISMSIPLFFTAVRNARDDVYVDGGVLNNYPVKLFDRMKYVDPAERDVAARRTDYYEQENKAFLKNHKKSSPYIYNRQTLGLRLDSKEEIGAFRYGTEPVRREIDDFFDYAKALISTVMEAQATQHLHGDDWQRTVYIDTLGVGTTDFDLSAKKKDALVESGRASTTAYFRWFNNRDAEPVNRCRNSGG